MPRLSLARGLQLEQISGDIGDRLLGVGLGLGPAFATEDAQRRTRPAGADVFADEVRLGHRHIQLGRILLRVARAVLDHEALLAAAGFFPAVPRRACLDRQHFQPEVAADAVLQMHDEVAHAQVGKIDLQRRAGGRCVGRLEPARSLRADAPKNLRVGDDDQLGRLDEKTARHAAEHLHRLGFSLALGQAVLDPQLIEPLQLALGAADCPDGVAVAQPAMQLVEKLAALGVGNLRVTRRLAERPVRVEPLERRLGFFAGFANLDDAAELTRLAKRGFPVVVKQVAAWHLPEVVGHAPGNLLRIDQQKDRVTGEVVAQPPGGVVGVGAELLLEDAELAAGRDRGPVDLLAGKLGLRIEGAQRLEFVAEKLEAHRPGAGQWEDIEDAAAQRDLPLLADLRLRLVALVLEPLDEVERVDAVAKLEAAKPVFQFGRGEGPLQQPDTGGDDDRAGRGGVCAGLSALGQVDEGLEPFAQHVGVRQSGLVRQDIPSREKLRRLGQALGQGGQPRLEFLMELLLKFAGGADDHHRPTLGEMGQNRRRKGPSALADAVERQHSSLFRAFEEGLQSGSFAQLGQGGREVWLSQTQFRRDNMGQARGGVKRPELKKLKKRKKGHQIS